MPEPSNAELIQQCLAGKESAWEILLSRYERLIYYTATRTGLDADDVADVFQTVCVAWLENLSRLRDPQRLGAWLVTTTRRESWARGKRNRLAFSASETALAAQPAPDESPEALAGQVEDANAVRSAFRQLSETCRRLLWLLYYDPGHPSYADIARQLSIPLNSLGPTRARCLAKLRGLLQAVGW